MGNMQNLSYVSWKTTLHIIVVPVTQIPQFCRRFRSCVDSSPVASNPPLPPLPSRPSSDLSLSPQDLHMVDFKPYQLQQGRVNVTGFRLLRDAWRDQSDPCTLPQERRDWRSGPPQQLAVRLKQLAV